MAEFASNAKGNLGVALGAVGTGLSALNGGLGNLLGGLTGWSSGAGDNAPVNRYEVNLLNSIAARDAKIEQLEAEKYTDGKLLDLTNQVYADFRRVGERLDALDDKVCKADKEMAVFAATVTATMSCMQQSIVQLQALTKVIVPNPSVCPGWGDVTITPATTTTTTTTTPTT